MTELRRALERRHERRHLHDVWHTFDGRRGGDLPAVGFGAVEALDEHWLDPRGSIPLLPRGDAELITYVCEGTLSSDDGRGHRSVVHAGEFQRTIARGCRQGPANASRSDRAHVFQVRLGPPPASDEAGHEERRFSTAERRGVLCIIASPDGLRGSLRIHQDARIYSALLDRGQHLVHEILRGRRAWLHLVTGEASLGGIVIVAGDGVGVVNERALSLTALEESEILLLDTVAAPPRLSPE